MPTKIYTFEELPLSDLDLELTYSYYHDPGVTNALPENCYPPETESEIYPPDNYKELIRKHYADNAEKAIESIDNHIDSLVWIDMPKRWMEDDATMYDQYIEEDCDI